MKGRPTYLAPCPAPSQSGRSHSMLHALRTGAGLAFDTIQRLERDVEAWRKIPESDRDSAAKAAGVDAMNLELAIDSMAASLPKSEPPPKIKAKK